MGRTQRAELGFGPRGDLEFLGSLRRHTTAPRIDATKILTRREPAAVLTDLGGKTRRSARQNLILICLAAARRSARLGALRMSDVRVETSRPHLRIRLGAWKGGRSRLVPLWWDTGRLRDLVQWKAERLSAGAEAPAVDQVFPARLAQLGDLGSQGIGLVEPPASAEPCRSTTIAQRPTILRRRRKSVVQGERFA